MNKLISLVLILLVGHQCSVEAGLFDCFRGKGGQSKLQECIQEFETQIIPSTPVPAKLSEILENIRRDGVRQEHDSLAKLATLHELLLIHYLSSQLEKMPAQQLRELRDAAESFRDRRDTSIRHMECRQANREALTEMDDPDYDKLVPKDHETLHVFNGYYRLANIIINSVDSKLTEIEARDCVKKVLSELPIPSEFVGVVEYLQRASVNSFSASKYNKILGKDEADQLYLVAVNFREKAEEILLQNECDLEYIEGLGDCVSIKNQAVLGEKEIVENFSGYLDLSSRIKAASGD